MAKNGKAAAETGCRKPLPLELGAPPQLRRMLHRVGLPDVVSAQKWVTKNSILLLNARGSTLDSQGDSQRRS